MARAQEGNGCTALIAIGLLGSLVALCGKSGTDTSVISDSQEAADAARSMYVTAASLNCRAEARMSARAVGSLPWGSELTVTQSNGEWSQTSASGMSCWVASRYLSDTAPAERSRPAQTEARGLLGVQGTPPSERVSRRVPARRSGPSCGGKWKCGQMDSCAEAYHYLNECGLGRLDRDNDGVPCESIC